MPQGLRLIVGLGNPGSEYQDTRHNVGFAVVDALAHRLDVDLEYDSPSRALTARSTIRGRPVVLARPLTYMNRSGRSVRHLVQSRRLDLNQVLVVYDDISLPPGRIRLRSKGGAGGHNGLQSIIDALGSKAFPRLRVGIGDDFPRGGQVDYVLAPFTSEQQPLIDEAVVNARDAALCFVTDGLNAAMNKYN